jgi:hypothetical protein
MALRKEKAEKILNDINNPNNLLRHEPYQPGSVTQLLTKSLYTTTNGYGLLGSLFQTTKSYKDNAAIINSFLHIVDPASNIIYEGDQETYHQQRKHLLATKSKSVMTFGDWHYLLNIARGIGKRYYNHGLRRCSSILGVTKDWHEIKDRDFDKARRIILITYSATWQHFTTKFRKFDPDGDVAAFLEWGNALVDECEKFWWNYIYNDGFLFAEYLDAIRSANWTKRIILLKFAVPFMVNLGKSHYSQLTIDHLHDLKCIYSQQQVDFLKNNWVVPCTQSPGRYLALDEVVELMNGWIKKRVSKCENRITFLTNKYNLILCVEDMWKNLYKSGVPRKHRENVCSVKETQAIMEIVAQMCLGVGATDDIPDYRTVVSTAEYNEMITGK